VSADVAPFGIEVNAVAAHEVHTLLCSASGHGRDEALAAA
jgi:hypothetical protein